MAPLLLTATGLLAVLVVTLAVLLLRLRTRLAALEARLGAGVSPSSDVNGMPDPAQNLPLPSLDEPRPTQYVITQVGEPVVDEAMVEEAVPTVAAPVFADIVLRETVVQTAALAQGLRRALSAETRNRIRFQMRQEVKRSRKQRRAELREVRREWAARQRTAMADDDRAAEGNAA